jgi:hypothetical protein
VADQTGIPEELKAARDELDSAIAQLGKTYGEIYTPRPVNTGETPYPLSHEQQQQQQRALEMWAKVIDERRAKVRELEQQYGVKSRSEVRSQGTPKSEGARKKPLRSRINSAIWRWMEH